MQWNERIGQNCHFIALSNSIFSIIPTYLHRHQRFGAQVSDTCI